MTERVVTFAEPNDRIRLEEGSGFISPLRFYHPSDFELDQTDIGYLPDMLDSFTISSNRSIRLNPGTGAVVGLNDTVIEWEEDTVGDKIRLFSNSYRLAIAPATLEIYTDANFEIKEDTGESWLYGNATTDELQVGSTRTLVFNENNKIRGDGNDFYFDSDKWIRWGSPTLANAMVLDTTTGELTLYGDLTFSGALNLSHDQLSNLDYPANDHPQYVNRFVPGDIQVQHAFTYNGPAFTLGAQAAGNPIIGLVSEFVGVFNPVGENEIALKTETALVQTNLDNHIADNNNPHNTRWNTPEIEAGEAHWNANEIQGRGVQVTVPGNKYVMSFNSAGGTWNYVPNETDYLFGRPMEVKNPADGDVVYYDGVQSRWTTTPAGGGGGVTDHGQLNGLQDDDHNTVYVTMNTVRTITANHINSGIQSFTNATVPFNVTSQNLVSNLNAEFLGGNPSSYFSPASHVHSLNDLSDVNLSLPVTDNHVLKWDNANGWWRNAVDEVGSGGGGVSSHGDLTDLSGATWDDHPDLMHNRNARTVTAEHAYSNRQHFNAVGSPFTVNSNTLVSNLNAEFLGGVSASELVNILNDLTDVNAPTPADGEGIFWNSGTGKWVNAPVSVGTISHSDLLDLAANDHQQYAHISLHKIISGQWTFNPTSAGAPFVLGSNAQGQLVSGFNANYLEGFTSSAFLRLSQGGTVSNDLTVSGVMTVTPGFSFWATNMKSNTDVSLIIDNDESNPGVNRVVFREGTTDIFYSGAYNNDTFWNNSTGNSYFFRTNNLDILDISLNGILVRPNTRFDVSTITSTDADTALLIGTEGGVGKEIKLATEVSPAAFVDRLVIDDSGTHLKSGLYSQNDNQGVTATIPPGSSLQVEDGIIIGWT